MSLSFPSSPSIGNLYFSGGNTWKWTGTTWVIVGSSGFQGSTGFQGSAGVIVAPGSSSQILFNDGTYANASSGLTFNKSSNNLFVSNTILANTISVNGYISFISSSGTSPNVSINSTSVAISNSVVSNAKLTPVHIQNYSLSDETSQLTLGTKLTTRAPYSLTLVPPYVRISLTTAGTTNTYVDITSGGSSIFSTIPVLPSGINSNTGPASLSATGLAAIADDTQLQFSISANGASAAGLKATIYYIKN